MRTLVISLQVILILLSPTAGFLIVNSILCIFILNQVKLNGIYTQNRIENNNAKWLGFAYGNFPRLVVVDVVVLVQNLSRSRTVNFIAGSFCEFQVPSNSGKYC